MERAKAAISDFVSKAGHHDTSVHETVAPGVQHETVKPHQHEEVNTAIDKEVHKDHYHRTVQPVHDREVLPEKHTAKLGPVQHREFDHRDHDETQRTLAMDQKGFKDERRIADTTYSQSAAPVTGGEHVHHHIHETIQPVVHKETIQPNVVHTTVPVHEVHHSKATHHDTTALPAMSMDEFKKAGGALGGREERYDTFAGEPKKMMSGMTGAGMTAGLERKRDSAHGLDDVSKKNALHGDYNPLDGKTGNVSHNTRTTAGTGTGTGAPVGTTDKLSGTTGHNDRLRSNSEQHPFSKHSAPAGSQLNSEAGLRSGSTTKPSMLDKLNPKADADGDGKRGMLD